MSSDPADGPRGRARGGPRGARPGRRLVRARRSRAAVARRCPRRTAARGSAWPRSRELLRETGARAAQLPGVGDALLRSAHPGRRGQRGAAEDRSCPASRPARRCSTPALSARSAAGIPERPATTINGRPRHRPQGRRHLRRRTPRRCSCPRSTATTSSSPSSTRPPTASTLLRSPSSSGRTEHTRRPRRRPRRAAARRRGRAAAARARAGRALRHGLRRRRRRPRPDRRLRQGPHAVRSPAGRVPGGGPADRRRLRRLPHDHAGRRQRRLAGRRGPRRRRRPGRRGVLAVRTRAWPPSTPASTSTAAWASTRPTRCTTTSRGSPTSRTRSAGRA